MSLIRIFGSILGVVVLFGLIPPATSAELSFYGTGRSIDGDSLYVGDREVRLFGIDAPEYHQTCTREGKLWACGADAAKQLSSLVTGKRVHCDQVDTDVHGRIVARCGVGRIDVNMTMVATGYAIAYRHYSMEYAGAEDHARLSRRGIWAGTFEMPREYRQEETQFEPHRRPAGHTRPSRAPSTVNSRIGCNIKGNRGSHGWIYHLPGMPYYEQTHAEEMFCTEAEAQAAGYRKAKVR